MIENFNSKQMYRKRQNETVAAAFENEENLDEVPVIAIGLTPEDENIDAEDIDVASIPEWDQMLNLLTEVDDMIDVY